MNLVITPNLAVLRILQREDACFYSSISHQCTLRGGFSNLSSKASADALSSTNSTLEQGVQASIHGFADGAVSIRRTRVWRLFVFSLFQLKNSS